MTISVLTVTTTVLNGRSTPEVTNSNLIFPNGFKKNDVVKANQTAIYGGATWYGIYECIRAGERVTLPASVVWASAGTTNGYMRIDATTPDPVTPPVEPPTETFPAEVWLSMTENGEKRRYVLV